MVMLQDFIEPELWNSIYGSRREKSGQAWSTGALCVSMSGERATGMCSVICGHMVCVQGTCIVGCGLCHQ